MEMNEKRIAALVVLGATAEMLARDGYVDACVCGMCSKEQVAARVLTTILGDLMAQIPPHERRVLAEAIRQAAIGTNVLDALPVHQN